MSIIDANFRTITCDTCGKTATFNQQEVRQPGPALDALMEANPWLKTNRIVSTGDGRTFSYHDDECEVAGITAGKHNPIEQKKVIDIAAGTNAIQQAAQMAKNMEAASKAMREGPAPVR